MSGNYHRSLRWTVPIGAVIPWDVPDDGPSVLKVEPPMAISADSVKHVEINSVVNQTALN